MKIAHVVGVSTGGIRQHVAGLVDELEKRGFDSIIIAPKNTMDSLHVASSSYPKITFNPFSYKKCIDTVRELCFDADVIHAHGLTAGFIAIKANKNKPVIVSMHNIVTKTHTAIKKIVSKKIERYVFDNAKKIIFPSNFAKNQCILSPANDRKSEVVFPIKRFLTLEQQKQSEEKILETLKRYGLSEDNIIYVCVARIHQQKDLPTLLKAFGIAFNGDNSARLLIAGSGSDDAVSELLKVIEFYGIKDQVILTGYIERPSDVIAVANVCVLASPNETIPYFAIESLEMGKPIVMMDTGIARELLTPESGSVVKPGDYKDFAAQMQSFADKSSNSIDEQLLKKIAKSWTNADSSVQSLIDIYENARKP